MSGTGAVGLTTPTGEPSGGIWKGSVGAVASQQCIITNPVGTIVQALPWYMASRFRLGVAADATTLAGMIMTDTTNFNQISLGMWGFNSTTKYVAQHSGNGGGTLQQTTVTPDLAYHTFEMWSPLGGNTAIFFAIDGVTLAGTQTASGSGVSQVAFQLSNGVTAAAKSLFVDWMVVAGVRGL